MIGFWGTEWTWGTGAQKFEKFTVKGVFISCYDRDLMEPVLLWIWQKEIVFCDWAVQESVILFNVYTLIMFVTQLLLEIIVQGNENYFELSIPNF